MGAAEKKVVSWETRGRQVVGLLIMVRRMGQGVEDKVVHRQRLTHRREVEGMKKATVRRSQLPRRAGRLMGILLATVMTVLPQVKTGVGVQSAVPRKRYVISISR